MKYLWMALLFFLAPVMAQQQTETKDLAAETSHYIVGSDSNYTPFQFRDGNQNIIGFEPDLLKLIGEKENFTVEFVYYPRGQWQQALDSGNVDIFSSALGISPKRTSVADMTDPFLSYEEAIYILDNADNQLIQNKDDFSGKNFIGIKSSASTTEQVKSLGDGSNVVKKETANSIFHALREVWAGNADAVINNNRIFQYYGQKYPQFSYRLIPLDPENSSKNFGFAVKKGRVDLRDRINAGLEKAKEDGSLNNLFHKWFGESAVY